jgi:hypothetical protein
MRIPPQVSGGSIVALGHFNPLIFRPDWLREKELVIGSDFDGIAVDIIHPDVVQFRLPWGILQVDRDRFSISATQEPLVRLSDLFVKCFQLLPETPITAVGLNRDVHFRTDGQRQRDRVGDVLAPKDFWHGFVDNEDQRAGGLRSLTMEQAVAKEGRRARLDGGFGWIHVKVEPSVLPTVPFGIYVHVNDHHDLTAPEAHANGRIVAELVAEKWDSSVKAAEGWIDRIMELASV